MPRQHDQQVKHMHPRICQEDSCIIVIVILHQLGISSLFCHQLLMAQGAWRVAPTQTLNVTAVRDACCAAGAMNTIGKKPRRASAPRGRHLSGRDRGLCVRVHMCVCVCNFRLLNLRPGQIPEVPGNYLAESGSLAAQVPEIFQKLRSWMRLLTAAENLLGASFPGCSTGIKTGAS